MVELDSVCAGAALFIVERVTVAAPPLTPPHPAQRGMEKGTKQRGAVRPIDEPIAWVAGDRILLNDTSLDIRRKVIACKDGVPNCVTWLQAAFQEAGDAKVHWWLVNKDCDFYLWIVWKKEG